MPEEVTTCEIRGANLDKILETQHGRNKENGFSLVHPQFRCIMYRCQSRPRRGANCMVTFALFEDDIIARIPTASSASLHMRLSIVGPLRGPIATNANTLKLRMNPFL